MESMKFSRVGRGFPTSISSPRPVGIPLRQALPPGLSCPRWTAHKSGNAHLRSVLLLWLAPRRLRSPVQAELLAFTRPRGIECLAAGGEVLLRRPEVFQG